MKAKYIFSSKKTRRAIDSPKMKKQKEKYPSILNKIINESGIILEILDARFPEKTRNFEVEKQIKKRKKNLIIVLNKSDLTEKDTRSISPGISISCKTRKNIKKLRDKIKILSKKIKTEEKIKVGVIGYPNTGKSSLINLLIGKKSAGIGADAGFTKGIQKLKLTDEIVLLDTPGVIPIKEYSSFEKSKIAKHTIVGGRSYSQVNEPDIVIANLIKEYPNVLEKHYKIKTDGDSEVLIETLGKKFNYFKKGGEIDTDKTARKILKDWQEGFIKI
jgi:ribosome biogenesis GTPase A